MKLIHVQLSSVTDSLVIKAHDTINAYYRGLRRITGFSTRSPDIASEITTEMYH